mgnify:CR=1 FL=1
MHVNRDAQNELQDIILEANKAEKAQLILVCGSVGDGKSHIISYFILGVLMVSLLKEFRLVDKRTFIFAVIMCILYAISDEVHQYYVPGRSGDVVDVLIDTVGSILGVWYWASKWKYKERKRELQLLRKRVKKVVPSE